MKTTANNLLERLWLLLLTLFVWLLPQEADDNSTSTAQSAELIRLYSF